MEAIFKADVEHVAMAANRSSTGSWLVAVSWKLRPPGWEEVGLALGEAFIKDIYIEQGQLSKGIEAGKLGAHLFAMSFL